MTDKCILGVDIGLRTLALCVSKGNQILHWNVYDIISEPLKTCNVCQRKATFSKNSIFYCGLHSRKITGKKKIIVKKIKSYSLCELATKVITKFKEIIDTNKEVFAEINTSILELQPKINQKMKFVSHVLFTLLCEHLDCQVKFERASVKLKKRKGISPGPFRPNTYKNRKLRSIEITREILHSLEDPDHWIEFLDNLGPKKDDACDSFLLSIHL